MAPKTRTMERMRKNRLRNRISTLTSAGALEVVMYGKGGKVATAGGQFECLLTPAAGFLLTVLGMALYIAFMTPPVVTRVSIRSRRALPREDVSADFAEYVQGRLEGPVL